MLTTGCGQDQSRIEMMPLAQALPIIPLASGSDLAKALLISGLVFLACYVPWQLRRRHVRRFQRRISMRERDQDS